MHVYYICKSEMCDNNGTKTGNRGHTVISFTTHEVTYYLKAEDFSKCTL